MPRETLDYDLLIVGGGPAGLAAAIRCQQRALARKLSVKVCLIEKGAEIGAHSLSGAILDPQALSDLLPHWASDGAPVKTPVSGEHFRFLTAGGAINIPHALLPDYFRNTGCFVISLADLCRWLARQAEALGVEIYPGFTGNALLFNDRQELVGVSTGDMGVLHDGSFGPNYQPGVELRARYTLFAEGCRGHLTRQLETKFHLREKSARQRYSLGLKELWEVPADRYPPGQVLHTCGWPLDAKPYGGGFIYALERNLLSVGFISGLDYANPYFSPFQEFQRFKTHAASRRLLSGGRRIAYGARAISEGGLAALSTLIFRGGALIGDAAGFLNAARIKGIHTALWSGMLAADAAFDAIAAGREHDELADYPAAFCNSALFGELYATRRVSPAMEKGLYLGCLLAGVDHLFRGKAPALLFARAKEAVRLGRAQEHRAIDYPQPDGILTFDRSSSIHLSNLRYDEKQPCPLKFNDPAVPLQVNLALYDSPEQRYCPAGVFEIVRKGDKPRLQINAGNCLHCKTCDIKDPTQNLIWHPPQGGDGPNYPAM